MMSQYSEEFRPIFARKIIRNNSASQNPIKSRDQKEKNQDLVGSNQLDDKQLYTLMSDKQVDDVLLSDNQVNDAFLSDNQVNEDLLDDQKVYNTLVSDTQVDDAFLGDNQVNEDLLGKINDAQVSNNQVDDALYGNLNLQSIEQRMPANPTLQEIPKKDITKPKFSRKKTSTMSARKKDNYDDDDDIDDKPIIKTKKITSRKVITYDSQEESDEDSGTSEDSDYKDEEQDEEDDEAESEDKEEEQDEDSAMKKKQKKNTKKISPKDKEKKAKLGSTTNVAIDSATKKVLDDFLANKNETPSLNFYHLSRGSHVSRVTMQKDIAGAQKKEVKKTNYSKEKTPDNNAQNSLKNIAVDECMRKIPEIINKAKEFGISLRNNEGIKKTNRQLCEEIVAKENAATSQTQNKK